MVTWHEFRTVYFERGLTLDRTATGSWRYLSSASILEVSSPALVQSEHGVRPVFVVGIAGGSRYAALMPSRSGRLLDSYRSELSALPPSVAFAMGAMIYHTKALARWASVQCADYALSPVFGSESPAMFSPEEPYFEFEALLSSIVQGYEYTRVPLWKRYGTPASPPRNFRLALERAIRLPTELRERLQYSHDTTYTRAKDYRDCIQHNVDFGSSSWAMMERRDPGVWTVLIRVPDNPETKSRKAFRFDTDLDALTLGWDYVSDFFAFADALFGAGTLSGSQPLLAGDAPQAARP